MGKELHLDMGNNLQGEWNTDTQSMHMCTFTASATEPLKYLTVAEAVNVHICIDCVSVLHSPCRLLPMSRCSSLPTNELAFLAFGQNCSQI